MATEAAKAKAAEATDDQKVHDGNAKADGELCLVRYLA